MKLDEKSSNGSNKKNYKANPNINEIDIKFSRKKRKVSSKNEGKIKMVNNADSKK